MKLIKIFLNEFIDLRSFWCGFTSGYHDLETDFGIVDMHLFGPVFAY